MYYTYVGVDHYHGQSSRKFRGLDGGTLYLLPERVDELLAPRTGLTNPPRNARIQELEHELETLKQENRAMKKLLKQAEKLLLLEIG